MIRMATWRTGGHQTPHRGSWSCRSASSISIATSPGTWPVDFMYVVLVDLIFLIPFSLFSEAHVIYSSVFQIWNQTLHIFFFVCFAFNFASSSIYMFPLVSLAHISSPSGVFSILCRHINSSPCLCLHLLSVCSVTLNNASFILLEDVFCTSEISVKYRREMTISHAILSPCQSFFLLLLHLMSPL